MKVMITFTRWPATTGNQDTNIDLVQSLSVILVYGRYNRSCTCIGITGHNITTCDVRLPVDLPTHRVLLMTLHRHLDMRVPVDIDTSIPPKSVDASDGMCNLHRMLCPCMTCLKMHSRETVMVETMNCERRGRELLPSTHKSIKLMTQSTQTP